MARTAITSASIANTGYNLTDSTGFSTLSTGSGNGVSFAYDSATLIYMKNDTGGSAVFTIKVPTPSTYSGLSLTIPDMTVTVANGKTVIMKPNAIFRQTDGSIYVECDVAGKVLILS